jgi:hypothetical protein
MSDEENRRTNIKCKNDIQTISSESSESLRNEHNPTVSKETGELLALPPCPLPHLYVEKPRPKFSGHHPLGQLPSPFLPFWTSLDCPITSHAPRSS